MTILLLSSRLFITGFIINELFEENKKQVQRRYQLRIDCYDGTTIHGESISALQEKIMSGYDFDQLFVSQELYETLMHDTSMLARAHYLLRNSCVPENYLIQIIED